MSQVSILLIVLLGACLSALEFVAARRIRSSLYGQALLADDGRKGLWDGLWVLSTLLWYGALIATALLAGWLITLLSYVAALIVGALVASSVTFKMGPEGLLALERVGVLFKTVAAAALIFAWIGSQ